MVMAAVLAIAAGDAMSLPLQLTLPLMQTQWASYLNPLLANPLSQGVFLPNVQLATGVNVINHLLGRKMQGWLITDINAAVTVFRSAALNNLTLTLTASGPAVVSLYGF